ncbi:MAG TPA: SBBP repeat-containing protein, partial [Luteitalea sp.]|nr:SBBP repeat-containing protein [Luteitalea sp.]
TGKARVSGDARLPGVVHRYVGTSDAWQSGLETFGRVVAREALPGIDVVYYGNQQQLEYDFIVAPGANPADAAMLVHGADRLEIEAASGDLLVHVGGAVLRQRAPVAYQDVDGTRRPVRSAFALDAASGRVGFSVGEYDRSKVLVIDPVLVYSTWFGGASEEGILAVKLDANGFIYVLGTSEDHAGFPTTPGSLQPQRAGTPAPGGQYPRDYFVSKFNPAGSALVYSTLFGGSEDEATWPPEYIPGGLALDAQGRVHIVGDTRSTDFPVTPGAADTTFGVDAGAASQAADAFYTRLNATGGLSYSTYIGGIRREAATGVAVDAQGNVYVVGKTASNSTTEGFVTTGNAYRTTRWGTDDLFVQRYSEAGALVYSTYFGGSQGEMTNRADIVANGDGKVTFGSDTSTGDLPVLNGFAPRLGNSTDGFVSQIDTDVAGTAGLLYSTYISGSSTDHVYALDVDAAGFVYVGGESRSNTDFPVTAGAARQVNTPVGGGQEPWDGFVIKLDLTKTGAASRVYSTFTGGNNFDNLNDIAVDAMGRVHLVGSTRSTDLPKVGAVQETLWQMPPYVQILNPTGTAFVFSSYLGSNTNGQALYAIAVNAAGETYLGGTTNDASLYSGGNPDGFRLVNAFQAAYGGGDGDAVLQKLGYSVDLSLTKAANISTVLPGQNVTFTLQVVNPSTDPASGVVVTDALPAGLAFVSCTSDLGGICGGTGNARSISFAQLAPGTTATIQIVAKMTATTPGQPIANTATVTAGVLDPVPANNTATANIAVPTLEPSGDADGDGLSNDFESKYGLDPFGTGGPGSGPNDDPDGDGKTNLQEL